MPFSSAIRILVLSLATASLACFGRVLDNGVDPENLGTGEWIYFLATATNKLGGNIEAVTSTQTLMQFLKKSGVSFIAVKAATGAEEFPDNNPQFTPDLVNEAHAAGLKIFGYNRSNGKNVEGEIAIAVKINGMGADGFIIDAEEEWESHKLQDGPAKAIQLCEGIRKAFPNRFLGHAPFPIISRHNSFPYQEFGFYCDAVMPQAYWKSIGVSPVKMVQWMDQEWQTWHSSLSGQWTNSVKPLAPIGQGWSPSNEKIVTGTEIMQFVAALNHDKNPASPTGYKGVSYWRSDLHTPRMWHSIETARIGNPSSTPESLVQSAMAEAKSPDAETAGQDPNKIILDDVSPQVTFVGPWQPGAQGNRFGTTYKAVATTLEKEATATAIYRPEFQNAGGYDVYVWYTQHANRSTRAPWVIHHHGGVLTNLVDQTRDGGMWSLLASNVTFAAGTNGYVTVANNTAEDSGHFLIADALQFVRKDAGASANAKAPLPGNPNDFVIDDTSTNVTFEGKWYAGKKKEGRFGDSHMCANAVHGPATAIATYTPIIENAGEYDVFIWYCDGSNRSRRAPWVVSTPAGSLTNGVDETIHGGDWCLIASNITFPQGTNACVRVSNGTGEGPQRVLIADAVRFVRKAPKSDAGGK